MTPAYTALGKEVLRNGAHHADLVTPEAAQRVADALNILDLLEEAWRPTAPESAAA